MLDINLPEIPSYYHQLFYNIFSIIVMISVIEHSRILL